MKKRIALGLLALLLSAGYWLFARYQRREAIQSALAYGRLAALPATAREVDVDTGGSFFSRTFWLTFQASRADIEAWQRHSPGLAGQRPTTEPSFVRSTNAPGWFAPDQGRRAIILNIPQNHAALYGTVWIDWQSLRVYVQTSHS